MKLRAQRDDLLKRMGEISALPWYQRIFMKSEKQLLIWEAEDYFRNQKKLNEKK